MRKTELSKEKIKKFFQAAYHNFSAMLKFSSARFFLPNAAY